MLLFALAGPFAVSCSGSSTVQGGLTGSDGGSGVLTCIPGRSIECTAPGGCTGGQICQEDGKAYGACICADGTGSPSEASRDASVKASVDSSRASSDTKRDASGSLGSGGGGAARDALATSSDRDARPGTSSDAGPAESTDPGPKEALDAGPPDDGAHWTACDPPGKRCYCIRVLLLGGPGSWGKSPFNGDPDPLRTWLDGSSTAQVDSLATHLSPITPELLAQYDLVVLQHLKGPEAVPVTTSDTGDAGQDGAVREAGLDGEVEASAPAPLIVDEFWKFSADEVESFANWVRAGGGLVSFIGYDNDAAEVEPANQLLENFGLSYATDDVFTTCPPDNRCYCWGDTVPVNLSGAGPIANALTHDITSVGALHGRSIQIASGVNAVVVGKYEGSSVAVAESAGSGRVFAFADERVTYPLDWLRPVINDSAECKNTSGVPLTTATQFDDAQFWSNLIRWASRPQKCSFVLEHPAVVP